MRPLFHPSLVHGRYGDPAIYIERMFEKRGLLFDIGDITRLASQKMLQIDRVFAHIDHFMDSMSRFTSRRAPCGRRAENADRGH